MVHRLGWRKFGREDARGLPPVSFPRDVAGSTVSPPSKKKQAGREGGVVLCGRVPPRAFPLIKCRGEEDQRLRASAGPFSRCQKVPCRAAGGENVILHDLSPVSLARHDVPAGAVTA